MNTTYENLSLRQRAKGLYAAGLAPIVVGSLPTIFGGALIASPVGFLTRLRLGPSRVVEFAS